MLLYPTSRAARSVNQVALRFTNYPVNLPVDHGIRGLLNRVLSLFV
jgi:hypothetical protein